jgi:DNA-directed RNA polymerase subunit H (RpoH/RPB5)
MRVKRILQEKEVKQQTLEDLSLIDPIIEKYKGKKGNLIPILQKHRIFMVTCQPMLFKKFLN